MTPKRILVRTVRQARRLAILVVGATVVLLGVLMVATPGPAIVVIPLGLAILGIEFAWARRLLAHGRERAENYADRARRWYGGKPAPEAVAEEEAVDAAPADRPAGTPGDETTGSARPATPAPHDQTA